MILRPCLHCIYKKDCEKKREMLDGIRGLKLTTASFKCEKRDNAIPPGTRVSYIFKFVTAGWHEWDGEPYENEERVEIAGTTMGIHRSGKLIVWLDEETAKNRWIVKLQPDLVKLLDEPIKKICECCGCPEGKENRKEWFCPMCNKGLTWEEYNVVLKKEHGVMA